MALATYNTSDYDVTIIDITCVITYPQSEAHRLPSKHYNIFYIVAARSQSSSTK